MKLKTYNFRKPVVCSSTRLKQTNYCNIKIYGKSDYINTELYGLVNFTNQIPDNIPTVEPGLKHMT